MARRREKEAVMDHGKREAECWFIEERERRRVETARRRDRGGVLNRGGDQPRFGDESSTEQPRKRLRDESSNSSFARNTQRFPLLIRVSKTRLFSFLIKTRF
uniref:Uncharacterized protein n=1 Tax=Brassica oleracea TaxID=3712 RepID=Q2A9P8_BRAOL|nr:hypothetical protein 26.t00019 [Brassica oleracea]